MTTTHTPAATNFPLAVRELVGYPRQYTIDVPTPSAHGPITVVAVCSDPDWAAFLVHAANHHEAFTNENKLLRDTLADLVEEASKVHALAFPKDTNRFEPYGENGEKRQLKGINAARRILSESATQ